MKLSNAIPEYIPSVDNQQAITEYLTQVKLVVEEIASKAISLQSEIRTSAPGVNDIEEGEFVRATVGGLSYIYTKKGGQILRFQLT